MVMEAGVKFDGRKFPDGFGAHQNERAREISRTTHAFGTPRYRNAGRDGLINTHVEKNVTRGDLGIYHKPRTPRLLRCVQSLQHFNEFTPSRASPKASRRIDISDAVTGNVTRYPIWERFKHVAL